MVATKLSEVASKGYELVYGGGGGVAGGDAGTPVRNNHNNEGNTALNTDKGSSLWDTTSASLSSATSSLSNAAEDAYTTMAGFANYAWSSDAATPTLHSGMELNSHNKSSWLQSVAERGDHTPFGSPLKIHNPYNRVRGRYAETRSSLSAVRSLLPLVEGTYPFLQEIEEGSELLLTGDSEDSKLQRSLGSSSQGNIGITSPPFATATSIAQRRSSNPYTPEPPEFQYGTNAPASQVHKNSETASQLAEGTVRALRDIALDEAVDLYSALRFWSERWENPLLSWFEAGPTVWFSQNGYDHQVVGQKVATIQAVLARRCFVIGELQQHLLRAGWQRGVAQWGVLGQGGGQWATVQGTYVMTEETAAVAAESSRSLERNNNNNNNIKTSNADSLSESKESFPGFPTAHPLQRTRSMERIGLNTISSGSNKKANRSEKKRWKRQKGYYASVFVRNEDNGKILMDDAALAEWSVDAMVLIRDLLMRASNGKATLPYEHNWKVPTTPRNLPEKQLSFTSKESEKGELIVEEVPLQSDDAQEGLDAQQTLPLWAQWASKAAIGNSYEFESKDPTASLSDDDHVVISNLPLMAAEVSELLDAIENIMPLQKSRRMRKLSPPSMFRRRWYMTVVAAPTLAYLAHYLFRSGHWSRVIKMALAKVSEFFHERVVIPTVAIFEELYKGREDISDKKARIEVIAALKEMIRSWLDDNHPEIPAAERLKMAELMDISLIERTKAESLSSLFELNQAVRLSFIEMQFIKKEMVNALYTMDDMMMKNEINTNLAAVTPAVLGLYTAKSMFQFFFYALLKLGKSREETYASFRQILTDIERLLVMRDNPPSSPFQHHNSTSNARYLSGDTEEASQSQFQTSDKTSGCDVLRADDMGMLMLHIHECRTILWRDHRRFKAGVSQSISEDLAELAGERGAVSVQQQLQILARMCRTYRFL